MASGIGFKGVTYLRTELCTGLAVASLFLSWGWGAPKAILGSSGLQVPQGHGLWYGGGQHMMSPCH